MITISLCMIVKNEESVIGRCLETVADLVDEFVIVDTGSTDDTAAVVNQFTSQIYTFEWRDDFVAAQHYAFKQATMDYILWLDADDIIQPTDQAKLRELKQTLDPTVEFVTMLYHMGKDGDGNVTFSLRCNRLIHRSRNFHWIGLDHKVLGVEGQIVHSDIAITHLRVDDKKGLDRNLNIYERRLSKEELSIPGDLCSYANELKNHGFHRQAIMCYHNFLNEDEGCIEDNISVCDALVDCYRVLGDHQAELECTLRSLQYDSPRFEFCCRIGDHFLKKHNYESAIFWYITAIQAQPADGHSGSVDSVLTRWFPHLQLSICYDRIGKYELACRHHELALKYRPEDPKILKNLGYFQAKLEKNLTELHRGKSRILIGSPVCGQPEIVERFLVSLSNLEQNSYEAIFFLIDHNENSASSKLLDHFSSLHVGTIIKRMDSSSDHICKDTTHGGNEPFTSEVASYKNIIIQYAREQQFDGLLLIDSDLLLHPHTMERLLETKVDIVSEVFWTRGQPEADFQPNVWLQDGYTFWKQQRGKTLSNEQIFTDYKSFLGMLQTPGFYEVGGLGSCMLISRRSLESGVNFNRIPNLSFYEEDRHFCIRAAALGLSLYVDTYFPAYHICRNSHLSEADDFLARQGKFKSLPTQPEKNNNEEVFSITQPYKSECNIPSRSHATLTLTMIVKNEAGRYLKQVLQQHSAYISQAVIIDDGSTDETVDMVIDTLHDIPVKVVHNSRSKFSNEVELRKQQWQETIRTNPTWILNLDADEWFEPRFAEELEGMLCQDEVDLYCFRVYDFWNKTHYREDAYWRSHFIYSPFLVRYRPSFSCCWKETPRHCGRFPENIFDLSYQLSPLRLKHFGWAKEEDRHEKLCRYQELDPDAIYGWREQYDSILDPKPNLIKWQE